MTSVSKISILAQKMDKIKMYNKDARFVQKQQRSEYQREIMEKYEPIFDKDVRMMRDVPNELCSVNIQQKFIDAKRNMITRRIQNMIEHKTMIEWQLPQLKSHVHTQRELTKRKQSQQKKIHYHHNFTEGNSL